MGVFYFHTISIGILENEKERDFMRFTESNNRSMFRMCRRNFRCGRMCGTGPMVRAGLPPVKYNEKAGITHEPFSISF